MAIILGANQTVLGDPNDPLDDRVIAAPADAVAFLNGELFVGDPVDPSDDVDWSSGPDGVTTTGLDNIDLWIGGLAEKILPFGGMLGSTFNFVFRSEEHTSELQSLMRL